MAPCLGNCCVVLGDVVSLELLTSASSGWHRIFRIANQAVGEQDVVVSWELLTTASSGWRCVFGIADQCLVWVAPYLES